VINTSPVEVTIEKSSTVFLYLNDDALIPPQRISSGSVCDSTCSQCYGGDQPVVSTQCYACQSGTDHLQGDKCLAFCEDGYTLESETSEVKRCVTYVQHFSTVDITFGDATNYTSTTMTFAMTFDIPTESGFKIDVLLPSELDTNNSCSITAVSGFESIACAVDIGDDSLLNITGVGANASNATISFTLANIKTNRMSSSTTNPTQIKLMNANNYEEAFTTKDSTFDDTLTLPLSGVLELTSVHAYP